MESEHKLSEGELVLLLEKKLSLLAELFQLAQKQIPLSASVELDTILAQKDQCIAEMQQTDTIISIWHESYKRAYDQKERQLLNYIQRGLQDILALEEQFESKLQKEKNLVSGEIEKLGHRSQFRNYLGTAKAAGKNLSFRR